MLCDLNDVFAEIRFDGLDAGGFQRVIEVNLLAGHRFRFNDLRSVALADQFDNDAACFVPIIGPMHASAAADHVFLERQQMLVELGQRLILERPGPLANQVRIGQRSPRFAVAAAQRVAKLPQNLLKPRISERRIRCGQKLVMGFAQVIGHFITVRTTSSTSGARPMSIAAMVIARGGAARRARCTSGVSTTHNTPVSMATNKKTPAVRWSGCTPPAAAGTASMSSRRASTSNVAAAVLMQVSIQATVSATAARDSCASGIGSRGFIGDRLSGAR